MSQNTLKTTGTFSRCHSFSTKADKPKLFAKFFAQLIPFNVVLQILKFDFHSCMTTISNGTKTTTPERFIWTTKFIDNIVANGGTMKEIKTS